MFAQDRKWLRWLGIVAEFSIFAASLIFLFTVDFKVLVAWLVISSLYLIGGFLSAWDGAEIPSDEAASLRSVRSWSWVPPVLAAAIGAVSAVTALIAKNSSPDNPENLSLMIAASLGVILSWMLLQVGFAQVYLILDMTNRGEDLRFPEKSARSLMGYLYFSFTLGTSFATSDVEIVSNRVRRVVLVHAVLSFFYNALVVAVAFQILQGVVAN